MKKSTLTSRYAWWYDANYKCMHQLHAIDFMYMLKDAEKNPRQFSHLINFLQKLSRISYGIPGYLSFHPRFGLFCAVERVVQMTSFPPDMDNMLQIYINVNDTINKTQSLLASGELEVRFQVEWKNKTFYCPHEVRFEDLYEVLDDWEADRADFNDVFGFAEGLYFIGGGYPFYPINDSRYAISDILGYLNMGYSYPILKEDIPAFKEYLIAGQVSPLEAADTFSSYLSSLDIDARSSHYVNISNQNE